MCCPHQFNVCVLISISTRAHATEPAAYCLDNAKIKMLSTITNLSANKKQKLHLHDTSLIVNVSENDILQMPCQTLLRRHIGAKKMSQAISSIDFSEGTYIWGPRKLNV